MIALFGTRWLSWQRVACLVITAGVVTFIFQRIGADALRNSLTRVRLGWFVAAFAAYGLALLLGGWRWHIALRAVRCAVHVGASVRLTVIGHFFFLILFGAAAGDIAKAALYARWYRFGVPELAASTPIDRALGALAAIVVGTAAVLLGFFSGGFEAISVFPFRNSIWWIALVCAAVVVVGVALVLWKPGGESWWARGWRTLKQGTKNLIASPGQSACGLSIAVAAQLSLASVFALNVRAVAGDSLPWLKLAWTFPAVMMLSCVPITVAGAGVREMVSLTLLGLYGVAAGECVGAALLTLLCKVVWSLSGGLLLWRESVSQNRLRLLAQTSSISVVIPALNEADSLPATVQHLRHNSSIHEIIVVDGGSADRTPEIAEQLGCRVLTSVPGRGGQMRVGARAATGDVILLLHADTWLPPHAARAMLDCLRDRAVVAGGFWKEFRESPLLLLGSKWKCAIRFWIGRRIAGDQGMFIRRDALEKIGGVPDMALMEEFVLCSRLRHIGRLALADAVVLTSARRFQKLGIIRTYLRMWRVATQYRLGTGSADLRKLYDRE